ncbi:alpha/beta-hydrolase [Aureobasidium pullulans]|nr:alpha/beta-hydrolase [Aureobasidium pullulans]
MTAAPRIIAPAAGRHRHTSKGSTPQRDLLTFWAWSHFPRHTWSVAYVSARHQFLNSRTPVNKLPFSQQKMPERPSIAVTAAQKTERHDFADGNKTPPPQSSPPRSPSPAHPPLSPKLSTASQKTTGTTGPGRPRWILHMQAQMWRFLMGIGMLLHRMAPPHPPKPSFKRSIKATVSSKPGSFDLHFYVPKDYEKHRRMDFSEKRYPCVINFHGGGFTLGSPSDDARWCGTVVDECAAVVVSVDYRLAPENPFPTAVEDGVDAVLYMANNADELGIDENKIALSGFSSGANMAFTVPLRLYDHQSEFSRVETNNNASSSLLSLPRAQDPSSSSLSVDRIVRSRSHTVAPTLASLQKQQMSVKQCETVQSVSLCAIVPWYPSCDYTQTREERRNTSVRTDQDLPAIFTNLFDESYLHPPDTIPLDSPYLSPGIAPTNLLAEALPQDIIMHTCQWDMLLAEGEKFRDRLTGKGINKTVHYKMIEGVPHGWDKAPNPLKPTPGVKQHYLNATNHLRRVFAKQGGSATEEATIGGVAGEGRRMSTLVN